MFDNSLEPDDPGVDQDSVIEVAEFLIGTKFDLRAVVEETYGWELLPDLKHAILMLAKQCEGCGLWVNASYKLCQSCATKGAATMPDNPNPRWNLTGEDIALLREMGIQPRTLNEITRDFANTMAKVRT